MISAYSIANETAEIAVFFLSICTEQSEVWQKIFCNATKKGSMANCN